MQTSLWEKIKDHHEDTPEYMQTRLEETLS